MTQRYQERLAKLGIDRRGPTPAACAKKGLTAWLALSLGMIPLAMTLESAWLLIKGAAALPATIWHTLR